MRRSVLHWVCVFALVALPVGGCSEETTATGGSGGTVIPCDADQECDDLNDCTSATCDSANDVCNDPTPVANGTTCAGGICQAGVCELTGSVLPCTEQGIRNAFAAGGGPYTFDCDGPTTVATDATVAIDNDVIIDGEGNLTVDGNEDHRAFSVAKGVTAELRGVAVTGGRKGGGIANIGGTLTLTNSTVSWNRGVGGVFNTGTMTVTNSTVSRNSQSGILQSSGGTLTLTNSTVSGNAYFGDIVVCNRGTVTVANSTVSGNIVFGVGNETCSDGGAIAIANSVVDGDCLGGDITSLGYNIESPGDTCGFDQETDQVNVSAEELNLGPLQDNGGPTETHALLPGSVAIDAIPADMCEVTEDQRGEPRPGGTMCDVGAFEVQP